MAEAPNKPNPTWKWIRSHKALIAVVIGWIISFNIPGFQGFYNAFTWDRATEWVEERVMKNEARKAQREYKTYLIREIEYNIRVLQFNIWCLKEKWKNLVDFQTSAMHSYMTFNYNQDIYLKEISEIHVMSEIKSYIQVTRFQGSSQIIS